MEKTKSKITTRSMAVTALMAAVLCIIGPLAIPIGPVPLSLALVGVFLSAYILGYKKGTLAVAIYILIGTVGLPVFSGFAGGPAKLLGPTGGYIAGYILTALISGLFAERFESWYLHILGMVLGLFLCYALGTAWFMFSMKVTLAEALATCVLPFVLFDLIKIALALLLGASVKKALSSANLI